MTALLLAFVGPVPAAASARPVVIVLHGLARTPASMARLSGRIEEAGFDVRNVGYPSTTATVSELAQVVRGAVEPLAADAPVLHFVTYSLGGIVARRLLDEWRPATLGRVVMIAPPNQGSEIVDAVKGRALARLIWGPALGELGTDAATGPSRLGPVGFETGVIAGSRIVNPLAWWLIDGPSDGTIAVERTRVTGMTDHIVLPHAHPFIMTAPRVATETVHFLRHGRFSAGAPRVR